MTAKNAKIIAMGISDFTIHDEKSKSINKIILYTNLRCACKYKKVRVHTISIRHIRLIELIIVNKLKLNYLGNMIRGIVMIWHGK